MGLLAADKLEELFPARNNRSGSKKEQGEQGEGAMFIDHKPKLFSVSVVDRAEPQPQSPSTQ